jgi:transposase
MVGNTRWSAEERALVVMMYRNREGVPRIADRTGRSRDAVKKLIKSMREAGELPEHWALKIWVEEEINLVIRMIGQGHSYEDVALKLGRTPLSVKSKYLRYLEMKERNDKPFALARLGSDHVFYVVKPGGVRVPTTSAELLRRLA